MGTRTSYRAFTDGLLAGWRFDTGIGGVLKILPMLDNTVTYQLGDGTSDYSFSVYLGSANTYFLADRQNSRIVMRGIDINASQSNVTAEALITSGFELEDTFTVPTLNCTESTIINTATADTLNTNTLVIPGTLAVDTVNCNTLAVQSSFDPISVTCNSLQVDGDLTAERMTNFNPSGTSSNLIGNAASNSTFTVFMGAANTHVKFAPAPNATMFLNNVALVSNAASTMNDPVNVSGAVTANAVSSNGVTVNGALSGQTLSVIPSADDTGAVTIGNATRGMDFIVTLGAAGSVVIDRGAAQMRLRGVDINTNAAVVVNSTITCDNTVTCNQVSYTTLNAGNTVETLTAESLTVIPAVDDTGSVTIGNANRGIDFKVLFASATPGFLLDRGSSQLAMRGVTINTNSAVVIDSATMTCDTLNTDDMSVNTGYTIQGNFHRAADSTGRIGRKVEVRSTGLTVLNTNSGTTYICQSLASNITFTLPATSATGLSRSSWFEFVNNDPTYSVKVEGSASGKLAYPGDVTNNSHTWAPYSMVRYSRSNVRWMAFYWVNGEPTVNDA